MSKISRLIYPILKKPSRAETFSKARVNTNIYFIRITHFPKTSIHITRGRLLFDYMQSIRFYTSTTLRFLRSWLINLYSHTRIPFPIVFLIYKQCIPLNPFGKTPLSLDQIFRNGGRFPDTPIFVTLLFSRFSRLFFTQAKVFLVLY